MKLEFDNNIPIYVQIADLLKKKMILGDLKRGDKLPSVRELATEYKVNPNTVQRVYQQLEKDGLCFSKRGMGTFVSEEEGIIFSLKKDMSRNIIDTFIKGMKEIGFTEQEIIETIKDRVERGI